MTPTLHAISLHISGASSSVYVLLSTDLHRHVAAEQQLVVPEVSPQSSAGLLLQRAEGYSQHRRPAAVSLY